MEFLLGAGTLILGITSLYLSIYHGPKASIASFTVGILIQCLVVASLFADWGYLWVNRTALDIALNSNIWIAIPSALALLTLLMPLTWGLRVAPYMAMLAALQASSFIPMIYFVQTDTDTSFLAFVPLASMYISILAAFMFLSLTLRQIPPPYSHWHTVAFGPRKDLIEAILSLTSLGFQTNPPETLLDSGSATGFINGVFVKVSTLPRLFPPAYRLTIYWHRKPPSSPQALPGFTKKEHFSVSQGGFRYEGLSDAAFLVTKESLAQFIVKMASLT